MVQFMIDRIELTSRNEKKKIPAESRTATATRTEEKGVGARRRIQLPRMKRASGKINETSNICAGMIGRQDSYHMRDHSR